MAKRLWDKGDKLDQLVHDFTVGTDPEVDLELVQWDAIGSAAHARMLEKVGLLDSAECKKLLSALKAIHKKGMEGDFNIPRELEDVHTSIETALVEELGESGKRIHAGRSRNDQVLAAMRLYMRHQVLEVSALIGAWVESLSKRFDEVGSIGMPGYTHMQRAMPSSLGMWLHAFIESLIDTLRQGQFVLDGIDSCPLGSAAGFGTSLPLDREYTAELLGFSRVQRSPIDVQNSRGKAELRFVRWLTEISSIIEKFSWDVALFVTDEYGFLKLPNELTTGSSIMPQKRNPDVAELLRARAAVVRGAADELAWVIAKLPSNYHRDFQGTKEPVVRALGVVTQSLAVVTRLTEGFKVEESALSKAMSAELYATFEAYRKVGSGVAFREAYSETAKKVESSSLDVEALKKDFDGIWEETKKYQKLALQDYQAVLSEIEQTASKFEAVEKKVF